MDEYDATQREILDLLADRNANWPESYFEDFEGLEDLT